MAVGLKGSGTGSKQSSSTTKNNENREGIVGHLGIMALGLQTTMVTLILVKAIKRDGAVGYQDCFTENQKGKDPKRSILVRVLADMLTRLPQQLRQQHQLTKIADVAHHGASVTTLGLDVGEMVWE